MTNPHAPRRLGSSGPEVFPLALGCMGMSGTRGETIVPVIGARTRAQLDESLAALDVTLSAEDLARVEQAVNPSGVAGTRYDENQMRTLDSEK